MKAMNAAGVGASEVFALMLAGGEEADAVWELLCSGDFDEARAALGLEGDNEAV